MKNLSTSNLISLSYLSHLYEKYHGTISKLYVQDFQFHCRFLEYKYTNDHQSEGYIISKSDREDVRRFESNERTSFDVTRIENRSISRLDSRDIGTGVVPRILHLDRVNGVGFVPLGYRYR